MHATRKLLFPSGPIDVTGTFQVESEAISNEKRFRWKYASTDRQSEESFFSALFSVSWSKLVLSD